MPTFKHQDLAFKIETVGQRTSLELDHLTAPQIKIDLITCGNTNKKVKPLGMFHELGFNTKAEFIDLRQALREIVANLDTITIK